MCPAAAVAAAAATLGAKIPRGEAGGEGEGEAGPLTIAALSNDAGRARPGLLPLPATLPPMLLLLLLLRRRCSGLPARTVAGLGCACADRPFVAGGYSDGGDEKDDEAGSDGAHVRVGDGCRGCDGWCLALALSPPQAPLRRAASDAARDGGSSFLGSSNFAAGDVIAAAGCRLRRLPPGSPAPAADSIGRGRGGHVASCQSTDRSHVQCGYGIRAGVLAYLAWLAVAC